MKHFAALVLSLTMALCLFGCGEKDPASSGKDPSAQNETGEAAQPLHLETLNVEFTAEGHDSQALLRLKKELPALLQRALAEEDVTADAVSVTFGTSADASWQSLRGGGIDAAFLPSEVYLAHEEELTVSALENAPVPAPDEAHRLCPELAEDAVFYENAVVFSAEADPALVRAFARAIAALQADEAGCALLSGYGSGRYLISPDLGKLLAPQRGYLACRQEAEEKTK